MKNHEKKVEIYIFNLCAAISQDFWHPKNRCWHTQLNVCEKEELQCFLYLIQIFGAICSGLLQLLVKYFLQWSQCRHFYYEQYLSSGWHHLKRADTYVPSLPTPHSAEPSHDLTNFLKTKKFQQNLWLMELNH